MKTSNLFFALLTSAALAACSSTGLRSAGPATLADGILVGSNGMSLYTFDKDVAGTGQRPRILISGDDFRHPAPRQHRRDDAGPGADIEGQRMVGRQRRRGEQVDILATHR